jgi:hypothetical protein
MPSGLVSILFILGSGFAIRRGLPRLFALLAVGVCTLVGGALMAFSSPSHKTSLLAGVYLANAVATAQIILYAWVTANVAGSTKRPVSIALVSAAFSLGNIIGPQTFQAKDAPEYRAAKISVIGT